MNNSRGMRVRGRVAAIAALGLVMVTGVASASQAEDVLCSSSGFSCTGTAYSAASTGTWTEAQYGGSWTNGGHNCTRYAGYRLALNGLADPGVSFGNGSDWAVSVRDIYGAGAVNSTPAVGSIAQWDANAGGKGSAGHVAYVEEVTSAGIVVTEDNLNSGTKRIAIAPSDAEWPSNFLHLADAFAAAPAPTIEGTGVYGQPLSATVGTWSPVPSFSDFVWRSDGVQVGSGDTYTPDQADIGHTITVTVVGSKAGYQSTSRTSEGTLVYPLGSFSFSGSPAAISGTAKVEYSVSGSSSISTPGASVVVNWLRNGALRQSGGGSLALTSADIGTTITVQYTYSKPGYVTTTYTSPGVAIAGYSTYSFNGAPASISGTAKVEYTLSASSGLATSGVTSSITWLRNGAVRQSGGSTLALTSADIGTSITVRYTFDKQGYQSTSYTSPAVAIAGYSTYSFNGAPAAISGTAKAGKTLQAVSGLSTSGVSISYTWYNNGALRQTGGSTLLLKSTDVGDKITVKISFDKQGYQATSSTSTAVTVKAA